MRLKKLRITVAVSLVIFILAAASIIITGRSVDSSAIINDLHLNQNAALIDSKEKFSPVKSISSLLHLRRESSESEEIKEDDTKERYDNDDIKGTTVKEASPAVIEPSAPSRPPRRIIIHRRMTRAS